MKIAILTMFKALDHTYSLVNVVEQQIKLLVAHGFTVKLLVCEGCKREEGEWMHPNVEWVEIINHREDKPIQWRDYQQPLGEVHDTFYEEATLISEQFIQQLQDVSVCIMHDILFQGWHYIHNIAVRLAQRKLPHIHFIAFTHSFPYKHPQEISRCMMGRYMGMPHTTFVYPTYAGIEALATQYQIPEGECRVVYNTLDLLEDVHESVKQLSKEVDFFKPEVLIIYPCRRTPAKQLEKVAMLAGCIKVKEERSVKIIYCDFPSMDIDGERYKEKIKEEGINYGLAKEDIVFTSEYGFPQGFPRRGVLDLFSLSNLFICPSFSESFGLTVLEAASRGNFLVLNQNVPALKEIGRRLGAHFMVWDGRQGHQDIKASYIEGEKAYYEKQASYIMEQLLKNQGIFSKTMVRRYYNNQWVWENQLAPLLSRK